MEHMGHIVHEYLAQLQIPMEELDENPVTKLEFHDGKVIYIEIEDDKVHYAMLNPHSYYSDIYELLAKMSPENQEERNFRIGMNIKQQVILHTIIHSDELSVDKLSFYEELMVESIDSF